MINYLPDDLLTEVFSYLKVKDLWQVKLVCCRWEYLAEEIMYNSIDFAKVKNRAGLICCLEQKPSIANTIKSVHLLDDNELSFLKNFLSLALSPNIRRLTGEMNGLIFSHLLVIAKRFEDAGQKLNNLQVLPDLSTREIGLAGATLRVEDVSGSLKSVKEALVGTNFFDAMLYFRESLRELNIFQFPSTDRKQKNLMAHLGKFPCLSKLTLNFFDVYAADQPNKRFLQLEKTLKQCKHLQFIELKWFGTVNHSEETAVFQEWLSANVEKVDGLRAVKLIGVSIPHVVEYFVYKYPDVLEIKLSNCRTYDRRVEAAIREHEMSINGTQD
ncbi:hypothetical protein [Parasitella parasitica]|uniref:F-box domain-containing protein n=1 Tax=Parasitella parasitica TaxID=35722 RepID=A0A0B7NUB3_9FUNG|nr:hypothetical protein [Parasitella parasitica]